MRLEKRLKDKDMGIELTKAAKARQRRSAAGTTIGVSGTSLTLLNRMRGSWVAPGLGAA